MLKIIINSYKKLWCTNVSLASVFLSFLKYRIFGKNIIARQLVYVYGIKNIHVNGLLKIGLDGVGFVSKTDSTVLNVKGKLYIKGRFSLGAGCRVDISEGAIVEIGNSYVNPFTKLIITNRLVIGDGCAISWDCQFVDNDFHQISASSTSNAGIVIEDRVWIGSRVTILKGVSVAEGCVVASGSLLNKVFAEKNCLIGGSPAKIIRRGICWK